jgi:ribonuclease HII
MLDYENKFLNLGFNKIIGLDEAGRGPLCGPLVVAGVIYDFKKSLPQGVNDSKKLSPKRRETLFEEIINKAKFYQIEIVSAKKIDKINILNATKKAMMRISKDLMPDFILTDAVNFSLNNIPQLALVKGDQKSISIASASILAKVTRDKIMKKLALKYPYYGLAENMGYPTKKHYQAIKKYGVLPIHRLSYKLNK